MTLRRRLVAAWAALVLGCASEGGGAPGADVCPALDAGGIQRFGPIANEAAAWDAFLAGLSAPGADAVARLDERRRGEGLPLTLWVGSGFAKEPGSSGAVWLEHPCATTVSIFAAKVPSSIQSRLYAGEIALEVNSVGRSSGGWKFPVDSVIAGVRGDALLVPFRAAPLCGAPDPDAGTVEVTLAIRRDGSFRVEPPVEAPEPEPFDCPDLPAFEGSDYVRCAIYPDLAGGEPRRLIYQRPCA